MCWKCIHESCVQSLHQVLIFLNFGHLQKYLQWHCEHWKMLVFPFHAHGMLRGFRPAHGQKLESQIHGPIGWNSWHSPTSPDPSFFLLMKNNMFLFYTHFVGRNTSTLKWSMNCDKCSTAEPILEIFMCQWRFHVRTKNNKSFLPADWCATIFQWAQTWLWFLRDVLKTESVKKCSFKTSKPEVTYLNTSYQCLPLQQSPPSSYQVTLPVQHSPDSSWWNLGNVHILSPVISPDLPRDMFPDLPQKKHTQRVRAAGQLQVQMIGSSVPSNSKWVFFSWAIFLSGGVTVWLTGDHLGVGIYLGGCWFSPIWKNMRQSIWIIWN